LASREANKLALQDGLFGFFTGVDIRGFDGEADRPDKLPDAGSIVLVEVNELEPEVDLNPVTYHKTVVFGIAALADTSATAESLVRGIGAVVVSDRTLGGACEWADVAPLDGQDHETETGSAGHIDMRLAVTVEYSTTNPAE